jgi:kynurenine formamidase
LTNYAISLGHIKEILANENVTIKEGDILLIRTGLSKWIRASTPQSVGPWEDNTYIGVDPTPEFLEWVWNNHIAALGSDATSVEAIPASDGTRMRLHEACLAGWGMILGELLDLEALAKTAARNNRWTFFLTICPINLKGGAATMANTLAIF